MQTEEWMAPDPPGVQPVKGLPIWRWIIGATVGVALLVAAVFVPIPWSTCTYRAPCVTPRT